MAWASLTNLFGVERSRTLAAEERRSAAYREVFLGRPSKDDQQLVIADLMAKSGFQAVTPASATEQELRHQEGKRELFGVVFGYLTLSPQDLQELSNAARRELAVDNQTGSE